MTRSAPDSADTKASKTFTGPAVINNISSSRWYNGGLGIDAENGSYSLDVSVVPTGDQSAPQATGPPAEVATTTKQAAASEATTVATTAATTMTKPTVVSEESWQRVLRQTGKGGVVEARLVDLVTTERADA